MKRVIMPVIMLAAMMQLNGAASRASALWSTARTSGLLRPSGQQVFTAGRTALPQGLVCPVGSRLISSGRPSTALRLSGRFGALAKTPTPQAEQGGSWQRFKSLFVPTGTAAVATYMAATRGEERPEEAYYLPAGSSDEELARAYRALRDVTLAIPDRELQKLMHATEMRNAAFAKHLNAQEMKTIWKHYGDVNYASKGLKDQAYETHYAEVKKVADAAKAAWEEAEKQVALARQSYGDVRSQIEQGARLQE